MLFIITGSCGSGKSTLIKSLKSQLPDFGVYDFDDYGVPEKPTPQWRIDATEFWLKKAHEQRSSQIPVILGGLIIPKEIHELNIYNLDIFFCLLDISEEERRKRLLIRSSHEALINDNEELIGLRKWVALSNYPNITINTTQKTPTQVLELVIQWISKNIKK